MASVTLSRTDRIESLKEDLLDLEAAHETAWIASGQIENDLQDCVSALAEMNALLFHVKTAINDLVDE